MVKQTVETFLLADFDPLSIKDDEVPTIRKMDVRESAIFVTGAYNRGVPSFRKDCNTSMHLQNCIANTVSETKKYMTEIDRCSSNTNWNSMGLGGESKCNREAYQCTN